MYFWVALGLIALGINIGHMVAGGIPAIVIDGLWSGIFTGVITGLVTGLVMTAYTRNLQTYHEAREAVMVAYRQVVWPRVDITLQRGSLLEVDDYNSLHKAARDMGKTCSVFRRIKQDKAAKVVGEFQVLINEIVTAGSDTGILDSLERYEAYIAKLAALRNELIGLRPSSRALFNPFPLLRDSS